MKKLVTTLMLVGALGVVWNPQPADASAVVAVDCLNEAIDSCNGDFSGLTERLIGIRGWCYMIRWGMCEVLDP